MLALQVCMAMNDLPWFTARLQYERGAQHRVSLNHLPESVLKRIHIQFAFQRIALLVQIGAGVRGLQSRQTVGVLNLVICFHGPAPRERRQAASPDTAVLRCAAPIRSRSAGAAKRKTSRQKRRHSGVSWSKMTSSRGQIERVT